MVFTLKNSDDSLLSILKPRKANKAFEDDCFDVATMEEDPLYHSRMFINHFL
jgi:hypothetical protein